MFERFLIFAFVAVGVGVIIYATLGRLLHFHRPLGWHSGGHATLFGELCIGIFLLSGGLAALQGSAAWIIPLLAAFVGGFLSQRRALRQHRAAEIELRALNAKKHPGIFDCPPPINIDATNHEVFDLYDAGACTYLGQVPKRDLKALIDQRCDIAEQTTNDLFMLRESLELFPAGELTEETVALLNKAFDDRDFLELRWTPPSNHHASH